MELLYKLDFITLTTNQQIFSGMESKNYSSIGRDSGIMEENSLLNSMISISYKKFYLRVCTVSYNGFAHVLKSIFVQTCLFQGNKEMYFVDTVLIG